MKKGLLLGTIAASVTIACAAGFALANKNGIRFEAAKAGGKDRTLVFDKDVTNVAQGDGAVASLESMRAYTKIYTDLADGFTRAEDGKVCIYYKDLVGGGFNVYSGFGSATVTSITVQYKADNDTIIYACWSNLTETYEISNYADSSSSVNVSKSDVIQTLTINSGNFIDNQESAKASIYPVVSLRTLGSVAIDYYSIAVNYTCK